MDNLEKLETEAYLYRLVDKGVVDSVNVEDAISDDCNEWVIRAKGRVWRFKTHQEIRAFSMGIQTFARIVGEERKYEL